MLGNWHRFLRYFQWTEEWKNATKIPNNKLTNIAIKYSLRWIPEYFQHNSSFAYYARILCKRRQYQITSILHISRAIVAEENRALLSRANILCTCFLAQKADGGKSHTFGLAKKAFVHRSIKRAFASNRRPFSWMKMFIKICLIDAIVITIINITDARAPLELMEIRFHRNRSNSINSH